MMRGTNPHKAMIMITVFGGAEIQSQGEAAGVADTSKDIIDGRHSHE